MIQRASGNWKDFTLGEVVTLQRGFDLPSQDRRAGVVPVISSSGVSGTHDEARVKAPGVVTGRYGTLGEVYFAEDDFWPLNTTLFVRDFQKNDPHFVYYLLKNLDFSAYSDKSSVPGVNRNHLHSMLVRIPTEVHEQRAIAHVLGSLDDKIELNRQMNQTLEQIAAALFRSWFVDFDPVRAKAAGRQPEGMDAETAALFPDRLVESEIGEIPEGWDQVFVLDVADINAWTLAKYDPLDPLEYIEISSVSRGDVAATQVFKRGEEPSRARRRLRHGDTVLSTVRPDRGAYFLSLNPETNLVASTGFAVVSPSTVPWSLLHSALIRQEISSYLGHIADGGAYPAVRPEVIGNIGLILPRKPALLDAYHAICGPLLERAASNRRESQTLGALRDTLLPRLLSGELRVPTDVLDETAFDMPEPSEDLLVQSRF